MQQCPEINQAKLASFGVIYLFMLEFRRRHSTNVECEGQSKPENLHY